MKCVAFCVTVAATVATVYAQVSGRELSVIDYASMIGGPLIAAVTAQAQSAMSTANFISTVGFYPNKSAITLSFEYQSLNSTTGELRSNKVSVPLLTILPIPYLAVEECTIEFNSKIDSIQATAVSDTAVVGARASAWSSSAAFNAEFSNQKSNRGSNSEQREFSMKVLVRAVQAEMPPGTQRLLEMLEDAIFRNAAGTATSK